MLDFLIETMSDTRFLAMLFAAVAAAATVLTLAMPMFASDNLGRRMKAVAVERERIRQRERERLAGAQKVSLRRSPKQYMKTAVERFNLAKWVGQEQARDKLVQAGYRGQSPYVAYLFFRMVSYRYQRGSLCITSNKAIKDWPEMLAGDEIITAAILDRLLHSCHVLNIRGRSYRLRELEESLNGRS